MKRPWQIWLAFGVALAVVLVAMGWLSLTALTLDRARAEARRQAALEETVRLALWRMDSALAPLIARESSRPYFAYTSFYPAERAYTRMYAPIPPDAVRLPSPLLRRPSRFIVVHFQFDPDGRVTSPQVPEGNMRDRAEEMAKEMPNVSVDEVVREIEKCNARLRELASRVSRTTLLSRLARIDRDQATAMRLPDEPQSNGQMAWALNAAESSSPAQQKIEQFQVSESEFLARQHRAVQSRGNVEGDQSDVQLAQKSPAAGKLGWAGEPRQLPVPADVHEGPMQPLWAGDALLLVRRVAVNGSEYVQGCQLDWDALKGWLLEGAADRLPEAGLEPVKRRQDWDPSRMLAALPVRLAPGQLPPAPTPPLSPVHIMLVTAWASVLLAAAAVAVLLSGAVSLSERRGAFVSAVTHELRTPLTTFRMYAEMLAEGMVDERKRKHYLETLRSEADRLGHLVENVLAYARLERAAGKRTTHPGRLGELLDKASDRLRTRAARADMELVVEADDEARAAQVGADPDAIEQVLFNLADNACKYAARATDRRVHLQAERRNATVMIRVRDHGPGIAPGEERRIFRPFCKSARQAAETAPGVGLGLALSRRLARSMGGELSLDGCPDGACFVLTLRVAHSQ